MSFSDALSAVLDEPTTIRFALGTDHADFGGLNLKKNPQKTWDGFIWLLPNNKEATITLVGKVVYSVIGDKTGPYFSLPEQHIKPHLDVKDMARAKAGFTIRFINKSLPEDALLPEKLFEHNQAALDYLHSVQEAADEHMDGNSDEPNPGVKPFLKQDSDCSFFIAPVVSPTLFPQFKGTKSPGVLRTRGQKGRLSLDPNEAPTSSPESDDPNPRLLLSDLPDPLGRYQEFKGNVAHRSYEMDLPPVFDVDGNLVLPPQYRDAIPDGTLVAVRGSMRMYNIISPGKPHSRPYMIVFQRLQVVGGEMVSWNACPRKRPHGSEPGPFKRFYSGPGLSKPRSLDEDESL